MPVAGVTQMADAQRSLRFWAGAALQSSIEKQTHGRRRGKSNSRLLNPSHVHSPGLRKLSPSLERRAASAAASICCGQLPSVRGWFHLPRPAAPLLSPLPRPPAGTRTWLGVQSCGWSGDRCVGFFHLIMKYELKNAFALLKTQYWRRNSKYVVNRNSQIVVCFAFVFPPKVISLPASWRVLHFSSSISSALRCSCFHPLSGQPASAASTLATAATCQNMAVHSWSLAALPPNIHCCLKSSTPAPGWETSC